ncbi:MAG TPA: SPOR domain-containing protein [Candidatus Binatus sp.]|jgi:DedD protein|nr:SPOR domain-containing protein [Candidatus Binatus sp.]
MASSQDTEITLGTGKLLVLFFGLVGICALFFGLGYSLGRKSEPAIAATSAAISPQPATGTGKANSGSAAAQPMTFYKSVEQKDANPQLTGASDAKTDAPAAATPAATPATPDQAAAGNGGDPPMTLPTASYFVQVAAVTKQEDADSLVDALKKKQYPALVAAAVATDKLFRVQVGPFADVKDAEAMRTRLIADGYSPILKK